MPRYLTIEIKAGKATFVCIAEYLPMYTNTDENEEELLLCASLIDSVAMYYSNCIDINFVVYGDFNFDVQKLCINRRLQIMQDLFK